MKHSSKKQTTKSTKDFFASAISPKAQNQIKGGNGQQNEFVIEDTFNA